MIYGNFRIDTAEEFYQKNEDNIKNLYNLVKSNFKKTDDTTEDEYHDEVCCLITLMLINEIEEFPVELPEIDEDIEEKTEELYLYIDIHVRMCIELVNKGLTSYKDGKITLTKLGRNIMKGLEDNG